MQDDARRSMEAARKRYVACLDTVQILTQVVHVLPSDQACGKLMESIHVAAVSRKIYLDAIAKFMAVVELQEALADLRAQGSL